MTCDNVTDVSDDADVDQDHIDIGLVLITTARMAQCYQIILLTQASLEMHKLKQRNIFLQMLIVDNAHVQHVLIKNKTQNTSIVNPTCEVVNLYVILLSSYSCCRYNV